jgi:preprotein translocase SecE subunit
MAEQPDKKSKTRRVRNPETFRERAVKESTKSPKRQRLSPVKRVISKVFKTLFIPFRLVKRKLGKNKFVRKLKRPAKILAKILLISYVMDSFKELKLVTWPGWKQSRRLTYAVLIFAIVFGAVIAGLDWVLGKIFKEILIK